MVTIDARLISIDWTVHGSDSLFFSVESKRRVTETLRKTSDEEQRKSRGGLITGGETAAQPCFRALVLEKSIEEIVGTGQMDGFRLKRCRNPVDGLCLR